MMFGTLTLLPCAAEKSRAFALKTAGFSILRADETGTISGPASAPRAGVHKPEPSGATVFGFSISPGRALASRAGNGRPETPRAQRMPPAEIREPARNRNVNRRHDPIVHRRSVAGSVHIAWRCRLLTWRAGNDSDRQRQA
jgi:hypothetical protein